MRTKEECLLWWKHEPFQHQISMESHHYKNLNSLDLSEVGVGKTPPLITVISRLVATGKVEKILVIASNSILDNWSKELNQWGTGLTHTILRGDKQKRRDLLKSKSIIYLINYEGVRVIFPELLAQKWDMIVCDEIHHIKSPKGSKKTPTQSWLVRQLGRLARSRKGLTGTVVTNDLEDVWAIAEFIDPAIFKCNFWGFKSRFMLNENANKSWLNFPKWVPKPGAVQEVQKLLEPYAIRFSKREVLKFLPPVLFERRYIDLEGEQKKTYNELRRHFVTELDGEEFAALQILTRVTKLLQIASGFVYRENEETYRFKQSAKLKELKSVLEEIGNKQVLIWAAFREDMSMIVEALADNMPKFINGDTPVDRRQEFVDQFNAGEVRYLIANPSCMGEGVTILSPYVIYYSRNYKLGERIQSLGRSDRPGAEKFENVTVIDLIAKDTVDNRVMIALENKEDLLRTLNPKSARELLL